MSKIFIYDKNFKLGRGKLGAVRGYKLTYAEQSGAFPAAIADDTNSIYGKLYELDEDIVHELDIFYATGIGLHERVQVDVILKDNTIVKAEMYEYVAHINA